MILSKKQAVLYLTVTDCIFFLLNCDRNKFHNMILSALIVFIVKYVDTKYYIQSFIVLTKILKTVLRLIKRKKEKGRWKLRQRDSGEIYKKHILSNTALLKVTYTMHFRNTIYSKMF